MALHFTPSTPTVSDLTLHLQLPELPQTEEPALRGTFFPAEWHPQSGVQLTWPHAATDWAPLLHEVDNCYVSIALEILIHGELLLIVTPEPDRVKALLHERIPARLLPHVRYFECPTNDTWARDHGFLTLLTENGPRLLDFQFNGWGGKFPADLDNAINAKMVNGTCFNGKCTYESHLDFVFEGGSIESDGHGTLMTTSACLLSPNRNPGLTRQEIESRLLRYFHADRVLWLDHGNLAGDDTDSHIDTLARFCPNGTIAYVQCTDPADEHYEELRAMERQLQSLCGLAEIADNAEGTLNSETSDSKCLAENAEIAEKTFNSQLPSVSQKSQKSQKELSTFNFPLDPTGRLTLQELSTYQPFNLSTFQRFNLLPLPLPAPIYDPEDGHRLPATYANFLVINGAVLMPTYGQPEYDEQARRQLQKAFPRYDIVPIDCRVLIRQHGSLHCSTMQFPVGVLY